MKKIVLIVAVVLLFVGLFVLSQNSNKQENKQSDNSNSSLKVADETSMPSKAKKTSSKKQYDKFPGVLSEEELQNKKAVVKTNKGTIEFEIFSEAPNAASNFIHLSKDGFYNGLTFHRVVPGFVIQGGDPTGTGAGGPGYRFEDEPVTREYTKGIVAMANAGPDTNGSQFFIMLEDNDLPPNYTIFGNVLSGQDVVDKIQVGDVMEKVTIEDLE